MFWPFKRKSPAKRTPVVSDEVWRVGDIAEVWIGGDWRDEMGLPHEGPQIGQRVIVRLIQLHSANKAQLLGLVGWRRAYNAAAFRKVTEGLVEEPKRRAAPILQPAGTPTHD